MSSKHFLWLASLRVPITICPRSNEQKFFLEPLKATGNCDIPPGTSQAPPKTRVIDRRRLNWVNLPANSRGYHRDGVNVMTYEQSLGCHARWPLTVRDLVVGWVSAYLSTPLTQRHISTIRG
ncbi:Uncharacterized protein HZ326_24304 [Fusarium oxysporum f. sp. albedinis]|nr:Uncharacterized protein HZ326_24304 [Fusarium oxysporum f. sp. albedinis]